MEAGFDFDREPGLDSECEDHRQRHGSIAQVRAAPFSGRRRRTCEVEDVVEDLKGDSDVLSKGRESFGCLRACSAHDGSKPTRDRKQGRGLSATALEVGVFAQ